MHEFDDEHVRLSMEQDYQDYRNAERIEEDEEAAFMQMLEDEDEDELAAMREMLEEEEERANARPREAPRQQEVPRQHTPPPPPPRAAAPALRTRNIVYAEALLL